MTFDGEWKDTQFWYPGGGISMDSYGPPNEREDRITLAKQANYLSSHWLPEFTVCERTQEHRDYGKRAQLRAEIDALVAHLYGLNRDAFSYILSCFPVSRIKEKAAFGEYMSKRKCLEEFDRIASIL
jgi:hypothetical protein